ncbi:uncharacterized protein PHALS_14596 [Plasmopara halstedii]|uniref:Uncharacterized protein n=1 Tax=Plasmopara halstedii TaxID=4781 RepID=A0A0P1AL59_PLAHL|nr:uncharacterized protein PHALS_14596 [Plasmopara halstedii]CEG42138.1 hypothetical protein PHALS_14596 [Plasmopara halstedii]|eukprot:XP_024578507.1 hypothetical protein PHALS_14596 [Plasmopara halstedii]
MMPSTRSQSLPACHAPAAEQSQKATPVLKLVILPLPAATRTYRRTMELCALLQPMLSAFAFTTTFKDVLFQAQLKILVSTN